MNASRLLRNTIHFIHATHWRGPQAMSKKQLRRFNYWNRLFEKAWDRKLAEFTPRKPRGKRKVAYDAFLVRDRLAAAAITADALQDLAEETTSPGE